MGVLIIGRRQLTCIPPLERTMKNLSPHMTHQTQMTASGAPLIRNERLPNCPPSSYLKTQKRRRIVAAGRGAVYVPFCHGAVPPNDPLAVGYTPPLPVGYTPPVPVGANPPPVTVEPGTALTPKATHVATGKTVVLNRTLEGLK